MQTNIQEFFKAKKLPPWLVEHSVFKSIDKVDKIFPRIGLPNCVEKCTFENIESAIASATALLTQLREYISISNQSITQINNIKNKLSAAKLSNCFTQIIDLLTKPESFISKKSNKITISLPADVLDSDKKPIFRKGEGFFRIYNKLAEEILSVRRARISVTRLRKLEKIALFKAFSSVNIPADRFSIAFSSDGIDGLWDIATMSMRGITSCQRWQGQYRQCLIGSIVDPFTAIIYLTSGTDYKHLGPKMIRRSVVRFVVDSKEKKPYIVVDRVYPSYDEEAVKKFIEFIINKTNGKFKVFYGPKMQYAQIAYSYIPNFSAGEILAKFKKQNLFSYQDTKIKIGKTINRNEQIREVNIRTRQNNFIERFRYSVISSSSNKLINKINVSERIRQIIEGPDFKYHASEYAKNIGKRVVKECSFASAADTLDNYTRKLCYHYFANKNRFLKAERPLFTRRMNAYYNKVRCNYDVYGNRVVHEPGTKFKSSDFAPVLDYIEQNITTTIKQYATETFKKLSNQN